MEIQIGILRMLEQNRDKPISGQAIAEHLRVSRTAIWKAVKTLRSQGYPISASTRMGYVLSSSSDILSVGGVQAFLPKDSLCNLHVFDSVESTNTLAKEMAVKGCQHATVILADTQTDGRGRRGQSFYSPKGTGLYMSVVLKVDRIGIDVPALCTQYAACAVSAAIEEIIGKKTSIKWINDILLDGKKVCGILSEGIMDFETGGVDWLVIGIGINVCTQIFPDEIQNIAASLMTKDETASIRCRLAGRILARLLSDEFWKDRQEMIQDYRSRLISIGKAVMTNDHNETITGIFEDIDSNGNVAIKTKDGISITVPGSAIQMI